MAGGRPLTDRNNSPSRRSSPRKRNWTVAIAGDESADAQNGADCDDVSVVTNTSDKCRPCPRSKRQRIGSSDSSESGKRPESPDSGVAGVGSEKPCHSSASPSPVPVDQPVRRLSRSARELVIASATNDNRSIVLALEPAEMIHKRLSKSGMAFEQRLPLTLVSLGDGNRREYDRNRRSGRLSKSKKKRASVKSDSESEASDADIAEGEWEVQAIRDWGLDDEGKIKYLIQWKGWEGADTWEPEQNLANAMDLVKIFRDQRQQQETEQMRQTVVDLTLLIERLESDDCDAAILFRLFRVKPDYDKLQKQISELKKKLKPKSALLRTFDQNPELNADMVFELITKDFQLENALEEVNKLLDLAEKRKISLRRLKKREAALQQTIRDEGDLYTISMENLVDDSLPEKFVYIKNYDYTDGVEAPLEPVIYCTASTGKEKGKDKFACDKKGCVQDKGKCPCVKESGRIPYEKDGTLRLDAREPIYECNSKCVCADGCRFRVVSRGCRFSFCIFKTSNERGWGLRALERIPKGKFITTYNGEVVSATEKNQRDKTEREWLTTYMFDLDYNPEEDDADILAVDARFKGNLARFINHSCSPNLQINPCWNENQDRRMPLIAFFTNRVINRGEELTIDYDARSTEIAENCPDFMDMIDPEEKENPHLRTRLCYCGQSNCRGYIM